MDKKLLLDGIVHVSPLLRCVIVCIFMADLLGLYSTMVKPVVPKRIVKKRTKKFTRHQCELFKQIGTSWRKPRGIDSPVRRRFKGQKAMPNKGYGSDRATKFINPSGFKHFPVNNVQDLYMLLMQNRKYAGVISHTVGAKSRKAIVRKAHELDVRLVNGNAKLRKVE